MEIQCAELSHFLSSGKFPALCVANNRRNKSELSENSHTKMFVINSLCFSLQHKQTP